MKKIEDYLHLYLGAPCDFKISMPHNFHVMPERRMIDVRVLHNVMSGLATCKPILRPLSDMTEDEAKELYGINPYAKGKWLVKSAIIEPNIKGYQPNIIKINWEGKEGVTGHGVGQDVMYLNKIGAEQHRFLLSKHFDLFELIPAGLAITPPPEQKTQL